jgi:hypothetical protein
MLIEYKIVEEKIKNQYRKKQTMPTKGTSLTLTNQKTLT